MNSKHLTSAVLTDKAKAVLGNTAINKLNAQALSTANFSAAISPGARAFN